MFGLLVWQFVSSPEWNFVSSPSLQSRVGQPDDILEVLCPHDQAGLVRPRRADACLDHLAFSHCCPQKRLGGFCYIPAPMQMLCNALELIVVGDNLALKDTHDLTHRPFGTQSMPEFLADNCDPTKHSDGNSRELQHGRLLLTKL